MAAAAAEQERVCEVPLLPLMKVILMWINSSRSSIYSCSRRLSAAVAAARVCYKLKYYTEFALHVCVCMWVSVRRECVCCGCSCIFRQANASDLYGRTRVNHICITRVPRGTLNLITFNFNCYKRTICNYWHCVGGARGQRHVYAITHGSGTRGAQKYGRSAWSSAAANAVMRGGECCKKRWPTLALAS